jgi:hypothetical protein
MNEQDRYFWDLNGYLVVKNVLSVNEIEATNAAIDHYSHRIETAPKGEGSKGSNRLKGTGRPTLEGLLQLDKPYCTPFRNMLAHPVVVEHLNEMSGPGFRLDHGPLLIAGKQGTEGLAMHGSGEPFKPFVAYNHQNGKSYCGGVTVTWQITDVKKGDGGFACVPGSHKSLFPMPEGIRTADNDMGLVIQPEMNAGDLLFFMDGALTHGTLPWQSERERRSVLFKYASRSAVRSGPAADISPPEVYWEKRFVDGMSEEQRSVMYGPYSGHRGAVPFLKVSEDGKVTAEKGDLPYWYG